MSEEKKEFTEEVKETAGEVKDAVTNKFEEVKADLNAPQGPQTQKGLVLSIVALVCAGLGFTGFTGYAWSIFALLFSIAAIVISLIAKKNGGNKIMNLIALIVGIVGIVDSIIGLGCWACACAFRQAASDGSLENAINNAIGQGIADAFK